MGCIKTTDLNAGPWMCPDNGEAVIMKASLFQCCKDQFCNNQLQPARPEGCGVVTGTLHLKLMFVYVHVGLSTVAHYVLKMVF